MRFPRTAGVLAHPTSFPSPYGIGDLGEGAYRFVDFLIKSRQSLWQLLPLGPTGYGDSPYQSFSAFAGNPLLISLDILVKSGLLPASTVESPPKFPEEKVDFGWVINYKEELLKLSFELFSAGDLPKKKVKFDRFKEKNAGWLDDFAIFMALKRHFREVDGGIWNSWPRPLAMRAPGALKEWSGKLSQEIEKNKYYQFLFFEQWLPLKKYANERGIQIIGDVPIFVAFDSADVWANPHLFYLDEMGEPTVVAGVPPDYFSETGQRWGNPLYRWDVMDKNGYAWWVDRLAMTFATVDIVRIDHFRGFDAYWEIPSVEPTAEKGRWVKGPGARFFEAMQEALGELPIVAEDLGVITPEVVALRDRFEFPGMKILQFAFGGERNSSFLPHNYGRNSVVYTGTHDNETTTGWYLNASPEEKDHLRRYVARDGSDVAWDMIRLAYASVADMAVVPVQDLLKLDNAARMNYPGKSGGWWTWRLKESALTGEVAARLAEISELFGRIPSSEDDLNGAKIEIEDS
ncbi:MAG: 4-alpha-glucanotransferase [Anaerolineae bacterium]|nr:MAG: 4-alpha-glucanotransferase [Anaerolineae bacterium]